MRNKNESHKEQEDRIIEGLRRNPQMMDRIEAILRLGQAEGGIKSADEVEELLIEEIRKLGAETLSTWAANVEQTLATEVKARPTKVQQREKKRSSGGAPTAKLP